MKLRHQLSHSQWSQKYSKFHFFLTGSVFKKFLECILCSNFRVYSSAEFGDVSKLVNTFAEELDVSIEGEYHEVMSKESSIDLKKRKRTIKNNLR